LERFGEGEEISKPPAQNNEKIFKHFSTFQYSSTLKIIVYESAFNLKPEDFKMNVIDTVTWF
jgi:hypothetical protein